MGHPYCTSADLQQAFGGPDRLVQATDWNQDTVADPTVIDDAIEDADSLIDSYLNKQRFVPLAVVPPTIVKLSARIARYRISMARGMVDEFMEREHEADLKWLNAVMTGEITLGVDPQPTPSSMRVDASTARSSLKDVSRQKLKGFS